MRKQRIWDYETFTRLLVKYFYLNLSAIFKPKEEFFFFFWKKHVLNLKQSASWKIRQQWQMSPAGIYLLKINNRNTRTRCEIRSKLTIKISERHQNGQTHSSNSSALGGFSRLYPTNCLSVFDNFGVVSVSLLLTLNIFHTLF